ncbi:MAG: CBS domain-containing protein [Gammaproteobacteria bacterium]|nr:CBS domain-containing protein [Gammaproteobacteria bacterium]
MNGIDREDCGSLINWLERLSRFFGGEPKDREQLLELLNLSQERELLDLETLSMMQGAMMVSELRVREVMTPRKQLVVLRKNDDLEEVLRVVNESLHSRIPVIGKDTDEVVGILLPKDLLGWMHQQDKKKFKLKNFLREVLIVPDSMRLSSLMRKLRLTRNHMAIVVDEYGSTVGLITLEDVLEQIVGDIEDEHDAPPEPSSLQSSPPALT